MKDPGFVPYLNTYMTRHVDLNFPTSQACGVIYVKFARFMALGWAQPQDDDTWINTKVQPIGGWLGESQAINDGNFGDYIIGRARGVEELISKTLSQKQQDLIDKVLLSQPPEFFNSDLATAMRADYDAGFVPGLEGKDIEDGI